MNLHIECKFVYRFRMAGGTPHIDGRKARSLRSREAIVEATLGLIEQGNLQPTAAQIAKNSGVSVRSVFQHFADLEDLFVAVTDYHVRRVGHLYTPQPYTGGLRERVATFAQRRAELHEAVTPIRLAAELQENASKTVASGLKLARSLDGYEVANAFGAELDAAEEEGDGDESLRSGVRLLAAWKSWRALRQDQRLSVEQSRRVLERLLLAVLNNPR